jgi:SpoVK/Ycf46/Vps4 family AAA+-type ATPase
MKSNYKRRTFTPTHINNFNNMLKDLDEKQKVITSCNKLFEESLKKPLTNESVDEKEKQMQEILKILDDTFKVYDTKLFTGQKSLDDRQIFDPNVYLDLKKKKAVFVRQGTPTLVKELEKNSKAKYDGPKEKKDIFAEINDISDLLKLIEDNKLDEKLEYNINLEGLHNIKEPLQELNNMIGMNDLKQNIVDQILYFSQNLHKITKSGESAGDYMHTVIYGPPGTGKTEIARIMGKIYSKMGILKKGVFRKVTRSDLVAGYLGQTAIKTKDVINECLGGVLFIDEAYALGNSEKRDSFSKECIDTLCEALSAHKDNLMVIIAGYENELKDCFFNYNQGLESRFTWRFKTDEYKAKELHSIFLKKVSDIGWSISEDSVKTINVDWFEKNLVYFKFFGRDMEVFLSKIKIAHSRRVFCKDQSEKTKITLKDLEKGFEIYLKNDDVKKRKEDASIKFALSSMYL